jgi:hypothetical protein
LFFTKTHLSQIFYKLSKGDPLATPFLKNVTEPVSCNRNNTILTMRTILKADLETRKKFRAVFARFGKKSGFRGRSEETILLTNVTDAETGKPLTDHIWMNLTESFLAAGARPGMTIEFEARVKGYTKGYVNKRYKIDLQKKDVKLSHPTQFRIATS